MHGHRAVVELLLRRAGSSGGSSSEGASSGAGGASGSGGGGSTAGPSGSVEAFMQSSKAEMAAREEKTVRGRLAFNVACGSLGLGCSLGLGGNHRSAVGTALRCSAAQAACETPPSCALPPPAAATPTPTRRPPPAAPAAPPRCASPSPSARMRHCRTPSSGRATNSLPPGTMRGLPSCTTSRSPTGPSECCSAGSRWVTPQRRAVTAQGRAARCRAGQQGRAAQCRQADDCRWGSGPLASWAYPPLPPPCAAAANRPALLPPLPALLQERGGVGQPLRLLPAAGQV